MSLGSTVRKVSIGTALIIGLALAGYYYISGIPEYALYQVNNAVENRDWKLFNEFVEVDSLLGKAFDIFVEMEEKSVPEGKDVPFKTKVMKYFRAPALKMMSGDLQHFIEKGEFANYKSVSIQDKSMAGYRKAFNECMVYKDFKKERMDKTTAVFHLIFENPEKGEFRLNLEMKKRKHNWVLNSIANMEELTEYLNRYKEGVDHRKIVPCLECF